MHRVYQPLLPTANRYLQEKWDEADYKNHRIKVELAVPVVSTKTTPTPFHLQVNLKKMQLEKERQALWHRENLLHSAKLRGIKQSQGRIDNWNAYCIRSLNAEKRRRDLAHIYWENQQLLKRLEGRKSELAQERWQENWHKEEIIRHRIAHYPRGWGGCQPNKVRWKQQTKSKETTGGSPVLSSGRSPILRNTKNNENMLGKSFWGSGNESRLEGLVAAPMPSTTLGRKKDVVDASGDLAQRSSKGRGSSAKQDALTSATKSHASIRKSLKLPENNQSPDPEETLEVSPTWDAEVRYGRSEKGPKLCKKSILWTLVPDESWKLSARKSPEGNCSWSRSESQSGSSTSSATSVKSSLSLVQADENSPRAIEP
ncbi:uncharacterized protein LOC134293993 [Anolis carolinensis]|uniref:uncharacterized protein LOC134293993 n=1 Tax=Anolis carolinensis TaxID=28377 RepID=UPI002F2B44B7